MDNKNEQFQSLKSTQKGAIAESWLITYLEENKWKIWWNTSHQSQEFDGYGHSGSTKFLIECKQKSLTPFKTYSIHENDYIKYEKAEKDENKMMLVFFVDVDAKELNVTNLKLIKKTAHGVWNDREFKEGGKSLIYFDGMKKIADLPQYIIDNIKAIQ